MRLKIQGGTARHDEPALCVSCRFAKVVRGQRAQDEIVHCSQVESRITFKVTACSEYQHRQLPSLWHMEDVAWILRTDPKNKRVGFVRASEVRPHLRHVLEDE